MDNIKQIVESLLFVAEEPLTVERIRSIIAVVTPDEVRSALSALSDEYDNRDGGFYLREVAGGYQLRTRPEYTQWIKRLLQPKQQRLSKAALETLAIIAYKQPVMRSDVEYLRGVDCGGIMRMLLERKFIRILGRKEFPGRPMIYGTTRYFLEVFDLKDLKDLPTPKEIDALGKASSEPGDQQRVSDGDENPENDNPAVSFETAASEYPVPGPKASTASDTNQPPAEKNGKNA
jgi:segregation and condensation protein B